MKKNRKGFTLVELLAVIIIISILVGLVVSSVSRYKNKAEKKEKKILRQNIISIFNNYRMEMLEEGKVIKQKVNYKISDMDSDAIINYNGKKCKFDTSDTSYIFYIKKEPSNEEVYCILFTCNGTKIIDDIGDTENTDCKKKK